MKRDTLEKGCIINSRYEVDRPIGSGGTSHVYLVIDRHIGRSLAMKVMDRKTYGAVRFAKSEIESLRCVRFPLFPAIHDAFCDDENIYIVSEYVKGRNLSQILKSGGLSRDRALALLEHICEALVYLHGLKRPLLYLDLKPDNIIVDDEGLPHLIDFGIAVWLASWHLPVGTAGYSPPEQYSPSEGMDCRTDIFALGMTYYAIRHGIPPDKDIGRALSDIRNSRIFSSSEKAFLARCTAPLKEDRFPCAREVLSKVRHLRTTPKRIIKRTVTTAVATGLISLCAFTVNEVTAKIRQKTAADKLVESATKYMQNGEYLPEGIGIIKACINSGNLPHDCEQEFIFEVAKNAMLVTKDYKTAAAYFEKLDENDFPEAADYMRLCEMQNSFEYDAKEAQKLIGRLFADMLGRSPSVLKYENLLFIADCFENYDEDPEDGLIKALSVLDIVKCELSDADDGAATDGEYDLIRARVDELIEVKKRRLMIIKTNRRTGEINDSI